MTPTEALATANESIGLLMTRTWWDEVLAALPAGWALVDMEAKAKVVAQYMVREGYETGMEWDLVLTEARRLLGLSA